MTQDNKYIDFDEYIRQGEPGKREKAVFSILYLRHIGFKVNNDMFANHSWYFRNALVRANYKNAVKGIPTSTPASTPTSSGFTDNSNIIRLVLALGKEQRSLKELLALVGLKDRKNFIEYSLNPSVAAGLICMLYPHS